MEEEKWFDAWKDPDFEKPQAKKFVPAGPYLLLLGDAGTGKSLIGRALASHLTKLYKEHGVKLRDVLCWRNDAIPSEPKISMVHAGKGIGIVRKEKLTKHKKTRLEKYGIRTLKYFLTGVTVLFIASGLALIYKAYLQWVTNVMTGLGPLQEVYPNLIEWLMANFLDIGQKTFLPAGMLLLFLCLVFLLGRMGIMGGAKGISGAEATEAPKLIVDNREKVAPFIDATGHGSAQLFGSIAWDPFQTGGLGTPEHQRTSAGDVHKAYMGILYIDEIKNLKPEEAVTLLTVLEDGQLPITLRARWHAGGTAAMAVSTEPVPCMTFLVAAGNFDSINQIHPALMDRIYGYGKVVRMNNDMPNTVENRRKYVQFIAQEAKRFRLRPFSRTACIEVIKEGRRRSGQRDKLTTKFRPMISIIKTAATLAMNEGTELVQPKHVKEAINEHCKTIQRQRLEHYIEQNAKFLEINPEGNELGQIYGLSVVSDPHSLEKTGNVLQVKGFIQKKSKLKTKKVSGYYKVTGIAKPEKAGWITDSVAKVRTVILQKYGIDIAQEYFTHIDFAQSKGIDGPSAGVTMTILLCSLIEGKPLKQDVAVTGEINVGIGDKVSITAVGGLHEKIKAAESWGFKKVVIPEKNLKHSINPKDYDIEVIGAKTLDDYLTEILKK
jgi:Lon-like ATP-dependent protease